MTIYRRIVTFGWNVREPPSTLKTTELAGIVIAGMIFSKVTAYFVRPVVFMASSIKRLHLSAIANQLMDQQAECHLAFTQSATSGWSPRSTHCLIHAANYPPRKTSRHGLTKLGCQSRLRIECSGKFLGNGRMGGSENAPGFNCRLWKWKLGVANRLSFPKRWAESNSAVQSKNKSHSSTGPIFIRALRAVL